MHDPNTAAATNTNTFVCDKYKNSQITKLTNQAFVYALIGYVGMCVHALTTRRVACPWTAAVQAVVRIRLIMKKIALATRGVERRSLETIVGCFMTILTDSAIYNKFNF